MFLNAYHVDWIDENGKLHVDEPQVREGFIKALGDYTKVFKSGCTPSGSVSWNDADNNNNFHNRTTVSTPNPSLSIPGKWLDDKNEDAYYNRIRTVEFPLGPDGKPVTNIVAVKQAIIFADAKNKKAAKSFISYLVQPENLKPYIEGSLGRWYPVMPELANTPFWTDGKDPHRSVAHKQYTSRTLIPFPQVWNLKAANVQAENLWGKATGRVGVDGWTSEKAIDELIARLKELMS
jgi:multiple sugar transport system substrate-binding protein